MKYHKHPELVADLEKLVADFPDYTESFSIGESMNGANMLGIRLRNKTKANALRPMVKLVGNMHGNEVNFRF